MAYGDPAYTLITAGSTATSANTAHLLFGSYQGLSTLNNSEVVKIFITASGGAMRIWDSTVSNNIGVLFNDTSSALQNLEWPPTRAGDASLLHIAQGTLGDATNPAWAIWRRAG